VNHRLVTLLALLLVAPLAHAQAPDELPPGHPQVAPDELPPGHPQVAPDELPPGHPQVAPDELPPGHPQVAPDELPPGHPQVAPDAPPPGHPDTSGGSHPHTDFSRAMSPPDMAEAVPDGTLPAGSIRVAVVEADGTTAAAGAEIALGIMRQGGDRDRTPAIAGPDGVYTYTDLPTGVGQAYRVNVMFEGATYSSTPFQLPPDRGYAVHVTRMPTTHDEHVLLMVIGQTFVEVREHRLHVVQEMQLANIGEATYVFPSGGLRIPLPEGWLAFQTQPVMTDQHVEELAGVGVAMRGSLPPGRVTLAYAFDLPISGSDMTLRLPMPFRTYIYRVVTEAPEGLSLDVEGMPRAIRFEDEGRPLLGTEVQRSPTDPALDELVIRMRGIPGPGPLRWIALGIALVLVLGGVLAVAFGTPAVAPTHDLAARRRELLAELAALEDEFAAGEIGPQYRQSQRALIVRSLASILFEEERAKGKQPKASVVRGASRNETA
jgi:hypothetical protein